MLTYDVIREEKQITSYEQEGYDHRMYITADNYEIRFDLERPGVLHILDTTTQHVDEFTVEEAVTMLKLMLKHQEELRTLKVGA